LRYSEVTYRANKTRFCSLRRAAWKQWSLLQNHLQDVCWYDHSRACLGAPAEEHAALYSEGVGFKLLYLFCGYHQSFESNVRE
jgi:hypothetical protein